MKNKYAGVAIFLGSMLLFGIQPMLGRTLLPSFGGTAAVWTVCLATYQTLLLVGYFYAHWMSRKSLATQQRIHTLLLIVAVLWSVGFALMREPLKFMIGNSPIPALEVLFCVMLFVGLPYTLLAAGSTLVQSWLATQVQHDNRGIYRLYALSNLGSFTGLFIYPLLLEPYTTLSSQWWGFAGLLTGYAVLLSFIGRTAGGKCSVFSVQCSDTRNSRTPSNHQASTRVAELPWLMLPALSVFTLNAITAHLGYDLTPLPLLWVLLLAVFLLSYVVGFTTQGLRLLKLLPPVVVILALICAWYWGLPSNKNFLPEVLFNTLFLGAVCIMLHAQLYKLRPATDQLTRYYLLIALGGALGGIAASVLAPLLFSGVWEYPLILLVLAGTTGWQMQHSYGALQRLKIPLQLVMGVTILPVAVILLVNFSQRDKGKILTRCRNFYGTSLVRYDRMNVIGGNSYMVNLFEHNGTLHGMQVQGVESRAATTCFSRHAGGLSILQHPLYGTTNSMRVAIAGMGMGTLSLFARPGDVYRYYEINPQVAKLARDTRYFTFLSEAYTDIEVIVADARRGLEQERAQAEPQWDVVIIDVYSGDAIPPHMSTREAFQLYLDRLAPGGILSLHLTNWHLELSPMVKAVAQEFGLHLQGFHCRADRFSHGSYWAFLTRKELDLYQPEKHAQIDYARITDIPLMSDERNTLLPYVNFRAKLAYIEGRGERGEGK